MTKTVAVQKRSQRVGVGESPIRSMRETARAVAKEHPKPEYHFRVALVKVCAKAHQVMSVGALP